MDFIRKLPQGSFLSSFSAVDRYYDEPLTDPVWLTVRGSLADVAREFDNVEFPGVDICDVVARFEGRTCLIRCVDEEDSLPRLPFSLQNILYDPRRTVFLDPLSVYSDLRHRTPSLMDEVCCDQQTVIEGAILYSRFVFPDNPFYRGLDIPWQEIPEYEQRLILSSILGGRAPQRGLKILMETGFINTFWPELAAMGAVKHAKEHHPEGNVWEHTLETFNYRKSRDLSLSLSLLLHDAGKPVARRNEGNAFDQHAQIGAGMARRFLERLGFGRETREETELLVREHMLPAFISRLPTYRTERVMSSPLFPKLLELYRCDLSSTFRGPEAYYEACKTYRAFLKHRRNPFRTSEGKKMFRLYVE